jgi:quercetin dioxygenase-like cupin family protein
MDEAQRAEAIAALHAEGLDVTEWFDEPHVTYDEHSHPTREVRIVLEGLLTIIVDGVANSLRPGDRFDLAPTQLHSAVVGPEGARYLAGTDR